MSNSSNNEFPESCMPWMKQIFDGDVEGMKNWLAGGGTPTKNPATGDSAAMYAAKLLKRPEIVAKLGKQKLDAQRLEIFRLLLESGVSTEGVLCILAHHDRDDACRIVLQYPISKKEVKDAIEIGDLSDAGNVCDLLEDHLKVAQKRK